MWTFVLAAVVLGTLAAVAAPFLRPAEAWETPDADSELERLLREKQRVLRTLKDLDQEVQAGLMDQDARDEARVEYLERAVELYREIASLTGVDPSRMREEEAS